VFLTYNGVVQSAATMFSGGTADYRRQARKIRASFAAQPLLRHHALIGLARQQDLSQQSPLPERISRVTVRRIAPQTSRYLPAELGTTTSAVERGFADHSADCLRAGDLSFSARLHLLNMGEKLGIPRFRANLIIALEQHRIEPRRMSPKSSLKKTRSMLPQLLAIVILEAAVVGLFVWACIL
jgi:hypothetical protein